MSQPQSMLTALDQPLKMHVSFWAGVRELVGPAPHPFFYFGTPVRMPRLR